MPANQANIIPWPTVFTSARLVLRPPAEDDATHIFERYAQDEDVTRFLIWRPHTSVTDTLAYISRCAEGWVNGGEFTWVVTSRDTGEIFGAIAVRPNGHMANIGYVLARLFWGRGIATEAGRAIVDHALGVGGLHRIWAVCDVENGQSARVLEKLGMQKEGILRRWVVHPNVSATPRDVMCYARVRS